jgi:hypothetical protein
MFATLWPRQISVFDIWTSVWKNDPEAACAFLAQYMSELVRLDLGRASGIIKEAGFTIEKIFACVQDSELQYNILSSLQDEVTGAYMDTTATERYYISKTRMYY